MAKRSKDGGWVKTLQYSSTKDASVKLYPGTLGMGNSLSSRSVGGRIMGFDLDQWRGAGIPKSDLGKPALYPLG